ncbi:MAG: hypothetical protein JWP25_6506 [Bradyrhizobium sp.]|jgi:hypothetical protein|nr:hypothetical protein [Bradyrhizobium sp.]
MVRTRRRFKQTTTLAERLTEEARRLRAEAGNLPAGTEQTLLWRKVRQAETALRIDSWLASTETPAPADMTTLMSKSHKKRSLSKSSHRSDDRYDG